MTISRAEFINLAADELGLVSVGQTLPIEDYEKLDERLDSLLASLASRAIVYIQDADEIPESIQQQLAILLAVECSVTFGKPRDYALRDRMEEELRVIARRRPPTKQYLTSDDALLTDGQMTYSRWLRGV